MSRVVFDTNVIVSAVLVPRGTQAEVLLLALRGDVALCVITGSWSAPKPPKRITW